MWRHSFPRTFLLLLPGHSLLLSLFHLLMLLLVLPPPLLLFTVSGNAIVPHYHALQLAVLEESCDGSGAKGEGGGVMCRMPTTTEDSHIEAAAAAVMAANSSW
jgi:hypothetical protein